MTPTLAMEEIRFLERDVTFRMPFRFGVITLTGSPQVFARVRVRLADGRDGWGMAAEMLAPKWFDKNPDLSNEQNFDQLRTALRIAAELYGAAGRRTAFGFYECCYREQIEQGGARGLNPLVACYGPALIDRAVFDALCRLENVSYFEAIRSNMAGIETGDLTPDLAGFDLSAFLAGLQTPKSVHVRHTVGMVDPIRRNDDPVGDGLPETLAENIQRYGIRYFKIKVGGDLEKDLARLGEIASVLDELDDPYHVTLDGNEQYADLEGVMALWRAVEAAPDLARFLQSTLLVEQPITRLNALQADVAGPQRPLPGHEIDESDATLDVFPQAKALGYRGVSSKACKGLYKSILNAARCRMWNDAANAPLYFMSGEDLTTQAGVAVQQDLALAGLLGVQHIERNGHHYVNGMAGLPEAEQQDFLSAHGGLYHQQDGIVRLAIRNGSLDLTTLDCPGMAVAAEPGWSGMREMPRPAQ